MNSNIHSIQYILIFPKRKHKWKYYLNGNFDDSYNLKTEDLKKFIFSICDSSISSDIKKYIQTYTPFLVDVNSNKVHAVTVDLDKAKEKYAKEFWKQNVNIKTVTKKYQESQKSKIKNSYEIPHANTNEGLIDRFTKIDY